MKKSVRLIGSSRAFTGNLKRLLEDCGLKTRVEKSALGVGVRQRSRDIGIFEVRKKGELAQLARARSVKPFLIYTTLPLPQDALGSLKKKGLVGIITREMSSEMIFFLVNKALFYKDMLRRNARAPVKIPIILQVGDKILSTFASNLSRDGIFILTLNPLPVAAECELEFEIPGKTDKLRTKGKVLYTITVNRDLNIITRSEEPFKRLITHPGMAVLFTSLPQEDRELINQYVVSHPL
jgi:hypothetical protein